MMPIKAGTPMPMLNPYLALLGIPTYNKTKQVLTIDN